MFRDKRVADHELRIATLALAVAELREREQKALPAEVFRLIESLQADIDAMRISVRSLHGKVAIQKRYAEPDGRVDDELQAHLDLQKQFNGGH